MSKSVIAGIVVAIVLAIGTHFILTNSHIDIFPCDRGSSSCKDPAYSRSVSSSCSLLSIARYEDSGGQDPCDYVALTGAGIALKYFVIIGVPGLLGFLIAFLFRKKKTAA